RSEYKIWGKHNLDGKTPAPFRFEKAWSMSDFSNWHNTSDHGGFGGNTMKSLVDTNTMHQTILDLMSTVGDRKFRTILADPPWQFQNRTGKMAPEHKRLNRYSTMTLTEIKTLPVNEMADKKCHLYL